MPIATATQNSGHHGCCCRCSQANGSSGAKLLIIFMMTPPRMHYKAATEKKDACGLCTVQGGINNLGFQGTSVFPQLINVIQFQLPYCQGPEYTHNAICPGFMPQQSKASL
uniref:Uncharacterized protein n=1 Tax=Pyxicephalus adspersus TaxID=30357 RepID=A0AAV3ATP7_PYXAD|nr:TPA: hypothetical protein GDO54_005970 [Pyxicephalus adspersus]